MRVVFDESLDVHYGFAHFCTEVDDDIPGDLELSFGGQRNGICGGAVAHLLSMRTGTHTGSVPFRIEWHDTAPPATNEWEDVVEVSLDVESTAATLSAFDVYNEVALPSTGPHRVRYSATGMDAAQDVGEEEPGDDDPPGPDRYLLQLWPAPVAPDEIVRVGTECAQYWHDESGGAPALSPAEIAAARAADRIDPDEGDPFAYLSDDDSDHVELLRDLLVYGAARQLDTARWLARETVEMAGLADDPAFVAALSALDAGRALPAPFDNFAAAATMALELGVPTSDSVETINDPEPDDDFGWYGDGVGSTSSDSRRSNALHAVTAIDAAVGTDPARAVVIAYRSAVAADDTGDRLNRALRGRLDHPEH